MEGEGAVHASVGAGARDVIGLVGPRLEVVQCLVDEAEARCLPARRRLVLRIELQEGRVRVPAIGALLSAHQRPSGAHHGFVKCSGFNEGSSADQLIRAHQGPSGPISAHRGPSAPISAHKGFIEGSSADQLISVVL